MLPACIASFTLTPEEKVVDAKCLEDGIIQIAASAITERTWKMTLEMQYQDWTSLQLSFDEIAQELASVSLPTRKTAVIDTNGEIADADVTTGNADSFLAYLYQGAGSKPVFLKVVTGAPAAADEVQYDATNNQLVFQTGLAGRRVSYVINKTYANIEAIGVADEYDRFGSLQFTGIVAGTTFNRGMQIVVPNMTRIKSPELKINGDLASLNVEYRLATPAGARAPFKLYNLG